MTGGVSEELYLASLTETQRLRRVAYRRLTPAERATTWKAAGGRCTYCGRPGTSPYADPEGKAWQMDHVQPLSRGGSAEAENVVLACRRCNSLKSDMTLAELRIHLALVLERLGERK